MGQLFAGRANAVDDRLLFAGLFYGAPAKCTNSSAVALLVRAVTGSRALILFWARHVHTDIASDRMNGRNFYSKRLIPGSLLARRAYKVVILGLYVVLGVGDANLRKEDRRLRIVFSAPSTRCAL